MSARALKLVFQGIQDLVVRKNFEKLQTYVDEGGLLDGFKALEFKVTSSQVNIKIKHGLGFVPKDVIVTRLIANTGCELIANYGLFTASDLDFTVTGLSGNLVARVLVGTFKGVSGETAASEDDTQEFKSKL